ncbi:Gamma-glutamyl phosphate reductase [uncultured archaeon]|nr:Gamma-glutamyl phosphate reductase [uncultured archaeon]
MAQDKEAASRQALASCRRIIVKIGTGVLTSQAGGIDSGTLSGICSQVAALHDSGKQVILVTSGAVGSGRAQLKLGEKKLSMNLQQASAAVGQSLLMEQYNRHFREKGKTTAQILLTQDDFGNPGRLANLASTIGALFSLGAIPIVNENDAVATEELDASSGRNGKLFGDNDVLSSLLAAKADADALIILSTVEGLLGKDGKAVSYVEKVDETTEALDKGDCSAGGRGGLPSKLAAMKTACESGAIGIIADGKSPGVLGRVFSGEKVGTLFERGEKPSGKPQAQAGYAMKISLAAKQAGIELSQSPLEARDRALLLAADFVEKNADSIISQNEADVAEARQNGADGAFLSRLKISHKGIEYLCSTLRQMAKMPLPNQEMGSWELPNGLKIRRVRTPLGAICVIFESRPDVVVEAGALAIKSGNAIIMKGGSEAARSCKALAGILRTALSECGLAQDSVQLFSGERSDLAALLKQKGAIELAVPRGGEGLISFVAKNSEVPVIYAGGGNCHLYVHEDADMQMAAAIAIDAKVRKPSACNAIETLLVHSKIAPAFLPMAAKKLQESGVELRCCKKSAKIIGSACKKAEESDWATEFLGPTLAVKVVDGIDEAASHINKYGTRHSEAIVTKSRDAYERFAANVDAAAIYWNASTRFTDGSQFGFGAELGISTKKLHDRWPIALEALYTYKYEIIGNGQTRG